MGLIRTTVPTPEPSLRADAEAVFQSVLLRTRTPLCDRDLFHSFTEPLDPDFLPQIKRCRRCRRLELPCPACGSFGPPREGPFDPAAPTCDVCGA